MELRLPYGLVGIADPSSLQALRVSGDGTMSAEPFEALGISVVVDDVLHRTSGYGWQPWTRIEWHERLKVGVEDVAAAMFD